MNLHFLKQACIHIFLICSIISSVKSGAQVTDTLSGIKLFSQRDADITAASVNIQQLNKTELQQINSLSVADAVKYFSGVVVKDYGGIGGLKTVSIRGFGANHTGVMYDGIIISDAQGGQIDLGRLSLDNIEAVQLSSNQPPDILMPARSFASAAIISLTSSLNLNEGKSFKYKLKAGSFGFINPSLSFKSRMGKSFRHSLSAEYQTADGDYPFIDYETSTLKKKRINADIKSYRAEYDAAYYISDSNKIRLKFYYYQSKRGLPGSIILYNSFSSQRLNDHNFFGQFSLQNKMSIKSRLLFSGKFSADNKYYLDPSYQNSAGKLENNFHQRELYISGAYSYSISPNFIIGYASDYFKSALKRTDRFAQGFANPSRDNFLNNLSAQFKRKRFDLNGNLLQTIINEHVETGPAGKQLSKISPALSTSFQPFISMPFRIRASFKHIFRAPTFDDLYYTFVGNTNLLPENAKQYSIGATLSKQSSQSVHEIIFTADGYYNRVTDKILAVPRQNLFQWTMLNIGKVDIKGIDISAHASLKKWKNIDISSGFSYSFQDAKDISNPLSTQYKSQLPYTPRHSGSVNVNITRAKLSFNYNFLSSSYRYRLGDPIFENVVQGWAQHDISVGYEITSKKYWKYKFLAEANNIYNKQYEIIRYYPMPRFNYRLGLIASFNK